MSPIKEQISIADVVVMIITLSVIIFIIFVVVNAERSNPMLSWDEVCQKHFGKDYVHQYGSHGVDFCVGDSGIPKYPKTWIEKR